MNRELLSKAFGGIDESFVAEACRPLSPDASGSPERIIPMKRKRIVTFALAAALLLALGITAYAVWGVHAARQQEIRQDLRIEESGVEGYVEYAVPEERADGLVLLSSVNDGEAQRVYVNISPVTEEEAAAFPESASFSWSIPGTQIGGFAAPQLPPDLSLSGADEIREAVLHYAYDGESQTLTLQCLLDRVLLEEAQKELGAGAFPLVVHMRLGEERTVSFGPVTVEPTEEQRRSFDFGPALYADAATGLEIEIVGLELTPFSAVWKVRYEDAEAFHRPGTDWDAYRPWSELEDRVCIESALVFSDGSTFSTGGAMSTPFEDGTVKLCTAWGGAIDINDVQRIVLGDLVLWETD